jgi:CRP/FNR family transcriptional regulator, cyclic AMP receptor protein
MSMTLSDISHQTWLRSHVGEHLTDGEARELFMISRRERFNSGDKLFEEGSSPHSLFLVAEGTVDIVKKTAGGTHVLASHSDGAIVGEMSLLLQEKRSASAVITSAQATVLRVAWRDFDELLRQNPVVAYKLMYALARLLSSRLKNINMKMGDLAKRSQDHSVHEQVEEFQTFKKQLMSDWSF